MSTMSERPAQGGEAWRRFGRPAAVLLLLLAAFLGLEAALSRPAGVRPHAAQPVAEAPPGSRWWRTRFPPVPTAAHTWAAQRDLSLADVLPKQSSGGLDGGTLTADAGVFLWGWAIDSRTGVPARGVLLLDNGRPIQPTVCISKERPDVATYFRNERLIPTGWNLFLPVAKLAEGEHVFEAFAILTDGKLGPLDGKVSLRIASP